VGAEYAASLNAWKDLLANVRDAVGGRSATLQGALKTAREAAESELASAALSTGAQGVLGVRFEFSHVNTGQGGHMLIVMATGTAVELEPNFPPLPDGE
ncbi:MAG TPA: heavy metal-binding domain-containing protein, partial [Polyangiaceae bacterium LLY-WYZ-14_1]|nr:heavy metal-binding domain-containing protein [Polyangiaceae bacterium LLY-WYZ-14_1]